MANFRSICILFVVSVLNRSYALYEDQVGLFDWKRSYIGRVKYASFENKRIIVGTDENVIASLNLKNGNIVWRQILEEGEDQQIKLLEVDNKEVVTVSGASNIWYVRGWDVSTGILQWEWTANTERTRNCHWITDYQEILHIVLIPNSHLEITAYDLRHGEIKNKTISLKVSWINDKTKCAISYPYYACLSDNLEHLSYINLKNENESITTKSISISSNDISGNVDLVRYSSDKPSFLLTTNNIARLFYIQDNDIKMWPELLSSTAISLNTDNKYLIYQLQINADNLEKLIKVTTPNGNYEVEYPLGLGAPHIIAGQCQDITNCNILLSSTDNALTLVHLPEGKVAWTREEALANIVNAEFFELPISEMDASIENEFRTSSGNIINMFYHRISTQTKQLTNLIFGNQLLSNSGLVRDDFGLHKIIVVATAVGKLFGIDTMSGTIVWSYRLPNIKSFRVLGRMNMPLLVQRTARYSLLPALCTLLAEDAATGNGIIFQFDPITGASSKSVERLNYKIKQAVLFPHENQEHLKPIIFVSSTNRIYVHPQSDETFVGKQASIIYYYNVDPFKNSLEGYRFTYTDRLELVKTWDIHLGLSKIASISTRPNSERVHSQGRVLPDRSVYYKYVNPNLIAVATFADDPIHKHVLTIYLIDGVTGLVLYSVSHRRARPPVHLVHSENWIVYSYFNERSRRNELVAAEMYEGYIQNNGTAFSSHAVSQLPHIQTQAYILPAHIRSMAVTWTARGITNKFLLAALANGGIAEVPWILLQPRFANIACGPEESCVPYMPEIPLPAEAVVNYNQSIERTGAIYVAPARLESTSHVLVTGLDMFYTRVAPSKTFDVLKEDFDHRLIVAVLSGLLLATYVTKHLAARKMLRQAWK